MLPTIATGNVGSALAGEYEVANSLRFDDGSSDYLNRTPSGNGTRTTWTFSIWFKRSSSSSSNHQIFDCSPTPGTDESKIYIFDDKFFWKQEISNSADGYLAKTIKFRDFSAWYNLICVWDTTNATSTERMKVFLNGNQLSGFDIVENYPDQNRESYINSSNAHFLGSAQGSAGFFDGYMAEVVFIDGQALDKTNFGEFDEDTGIWKPIDVSGLTFGTNGFYLDFENSGSLGADVSGNGNNFTVNNLTSIDQSTDTCTNNFCTWNPLYIRQTIKPAYSEGNLDVLHDNSSFNEGAIGTIASDSGKWYAEFLVEAVGGNCNLGIIDIDNTTATDTLNVGFIYKSGGDKRVSGSDSSYGNSYTTNDIIGMAMDLDNSKVYFSKNGTFQDSGDPTSGSTGTGAISITAGKFYTWFSSNYQNGSIVMNAGSPSYAISSGNADANGYGNFEYSVPSGYYALNTKNLAEFG